MEYGIIFKITELMKQNQILVLVMSWKWYSLSNDLFQETKQVNCKAEMDSSQMLLALQYPTTDIAGGPGQAAKAILTNFQSFSNIVR